MRISDWSSDVCSSDLQEDADAIGPPRVGDALQPGDETRLQEDRGRVDIVHRHRVDPDRGVGARIVDQPPVEMVGQAPPVEDRAPGIAALDAAVGIRSEEHTSELQSLMRISYAVFCLKKKNKKHKNHKE